MSARILVVDDSEMVRELHGFALRKGGYTGDLCIENESLGRFPNEQRREVLTREAEFLRQIAAMS